MKPIPHIPSFTSEQASDAILEAGSIISRLIQSPCTVEELSAAFPHLSSQDLGRVLRRLVRSGLASQEGPRFGATSRLMCSYPQGTQMAYLSRLLIPAVVDLSFESREGLLLTTYLDLTPDEQENFFATKVLRLFEELSAIADECDDEGQDRIVFVAGTPNFNPHLQGFDQALELLRQAGKDRASPTWRERSTLSYFQSRMTSTAKANQAILRFEQSLEPRKANPFEAKYALMLGFTAVPSQGESR